MTATLRHRGPDDEGYYVNGPVALGHRRLNIIDLATGHQPIANETGTIHAMLNGEIYNYRRLATELQARGHRFTTSSDTEVIVHAWEEYGEDCLAHFNGMFALVRVGRRAPDALRRPRPHGREAVLLRRASRGLRLRLRAACAPGPSRRRPQSRPARAVALPDERVSFRTPTRSSRASSSCRPGIRSRSPAARRAWSATGTCRSMPCDETAPRSRPRPGRSGCWDALCTSVRHRLVSDVPLGVFLSGGIDSSAVTAAAVAVAPGQRFQTFSMGFEEASYSEERFARAVAERLGTTHHQFMFTAARRRGAAPAPRHAARRAAGGPRVPPHAAPRAAYARGR